MIKKFEELAVIDNVAKSLQKSFGAAPDLSGMLKAIWTSVAEVYAATAAYLAPSIGPFAVPAAAAVAATVGVGAAAFMGKAEQGAYNIPGPGPSMWMLHPNETVLPAPAANAFRQMAEGGGGFGGGENHFHFHFQGTDGASFMRTVQQNKDVLARVLTEHMNKNPSTYGR
jgi:hypothetical protein